MKTAHSSWTLHLYRWMAHCLCILSMFLEDQSISYFRNMVLLGSLWYAVMPDRFFLGLPTCMAEILYIGILCYFYFQVHYLLDADNVCGWSGRDIKGANILVGPNGEIKLADFGMAKHVSSYKNRCCFNFITNQIIFFQFYRSILAVSQLVVICIFLCLIPVGWLCAFNLQFFIYQSAGFYQFSFNSHNFQPITMPL